MTAPAKTGRSPYRVHLSLVNRIHAAALPLDVQLAEVVPVGFDRADLLDRILVAHPVQEVLEPAHDGHLEGVIRIDFDDTAIPARGSRSEGGTRRSAMALLLPKPLHPSDCALGIIGIRGRGTAVFVNLVIPLIVVLTGREAGRRRVVGSSVGFLFVRRHLSPSATHGRRLVRCRGKVGVMVVK